MANVCKDKDKFKTSEAATKAALRTRGVIDRFLNILNLPKFRELNVLWSNDAKARFGIQEKLFAEDGLKAVPNRAAFKAIDNAKGIYYQVQDVPASTASEETVQKVIEVAKKMGINLQKLSDYAAATGLDVKGANGVADLVRGIIAVAEGREGAAITEEMVHIATAVLEQTNPTMVTEMISKIDRFQIYQRTLDQYKNNPKYQLANGKPDIRKIKKEAVDKLIAELIINNEEGIAEFPELRSENNKSMIRSWWNAILDWFRGAYKKSNISIFEEAAGRIMTANVGATYERVDGSVYLKMIDTARDNVSTILENYLNKFGIPVMDVTEMKYALGIDELGFADILSKIIYVKDKRDLPPLAGEVIAYMMQYNPLVKDIIRSYATEDKALKTNTAAIYYVASGLGKSQLAKAKPNKFVDMDVLIAKAIMNITGKTMSTWQASKAISENKDIAKELVRLINEVKDTHIILSPLNDRKLQRLGFNYSRYFVPDEESTPTIIQGIRSRTTNPYETDELHYNKTYVTPYLGERKNTLKIPGYIADQFEDLDNEPGLITEYLPRGYYSYSDDYKELDKREYLKRIGNLIADELQRRVNVQLSQSLLTKISDLVKEFFGIANRNKQSLEGLNTNIGYIVDQILNDNKNLITASEYKPGAYGKAVSPVSMEAALGKDNFGKSIIYKLSKYGFILTGSTALSEQGSIFRPDENPLHDIDWVSPFTREETVNKFMEAYPEAIKIRDIFGDGYVTDSFLIAPAGYKVINYKSTNYDGKIVINSYDVVDKSGKVVGTYRLQRKEGSRKNEEVVTGVEAKAIDFFSYYGDPSSKINTIFSFTSGDGEQILLANWQDTFRAKLNFARYKDLWDYNRYVPNENEKILYEQGKTKLIPTTDLFAEDNVFFQLSNPQLAIQKQLMQTADSIERVESKESTDPMFMDTEEANNWYVLKKPDGTKERILNRVTDRVKAWYNQRFHGKVFTAEEKAFNEFKRTLGIKGHAYFEEIHKRYFNSDGTRKVSIGPRPVIANKNEEDIYTKLEKYYSDLIARFSENGKTPLVFSEVKLYDPKAKEAGTIDLLIVEESGKAHIIDWKFMSMTADSKDVAWYKQGAYNIQLGRYKDILRDVYGVKEFGWNRAIPIIMNIGREDPKVKTSDMILKGIAIGTVDPTQIEDLRLVPVSEETESTEELLPEEDKKYAAALDQLIKKLNGVYRQIAKAKVTDEEEREFKRERLNILKQAIRVAQGSLNIAPLVDVIKIMRKEGQQILDDYNTTYKDRPVGLKDFRDKSLSEFSDNMREYMVMADIFGRIDDKIGKMIYNKDMEKTAKTIAEKEEVAMRKELLRDISDQARAIRLSGEEIETISKVFADKFIGERNLVAGLLTPEAIVKGLSATFRGVSELPLASLQILYKLVTNSKAKASQDALKEVEELMAIRSNLAKRGGNLRAIVQQIYQRDEKGKLVNKLIRRYQKKFFDDVDANALEDARSKAWLKDNIDVAAYKEEADKIMKERIDRIKDLHDEDPVEMLEDLIDQEERKWNIDHPEFNGWSNYVIKRHPLQKWESKEYIELKKDPELMKLYNFIQKMNDKAKESGYISNRLSSTFLPFVRKSMAESLAWDFSISAIKNMGNALTLQADDVGYGAVNELTGELEDSIPKYYTQDFTKTDGENDYSDVSEDLFKNMILYINHVEKYKYLSDVEGQLQLVKTIETFKAHLKTSRTGELIIEDGKPKELAGNEENTKTFNDFLRTLLYEQKYALSDADTPLGIGKVFNFVKEAVNSVAGKEVFKINENPSATSLIKAMDAANRAFQVKTLGLEFISGAVNIFGGNIQVATQAGNYFKAREFLANEMKLVGNKFTNNEERQMFIQLIDLFMPLKDDPTYDKLKEAGMTTLTQHNFSDLLMVFMREPEQHLEKSIFLTLLQNTMVVDGKIVNIREYVKSKYKTRYQSAAAYRETSKKIDIEIEQLKRTKSIDVTKRLVNGKLEIPGLDLTDRNELQRLTNLTRRISRNATGGLADSDINRMNMNVWSRSMMVFKNWIPKLIDTRFSEFRKVSDDFSVQIDEDGLVTGEKYDIGRVRLWAYVMGTSIRDKSANIYNILSLNDQGLEVLDKMYDDFAQKYEKRTGKPLNMGREEFIDLIRTNLHNQMKELAIGLSLLAAAMSMGFIAPDDDDDKAKKNFYRYSQRVIDKFIGELSFFYNPVEFQKMLSGSIFPAIGIFSDIERFISHFTMETTGYDISNRELTVDEVRKKAQPVKNLAKMFPFTKSMITYMAIFDSEFAKEFDVTIQKESRR